MATLDETLQSTKDLMGRVKSEGITAGGVPQSFSADALNKALVAVDLPTVPTDNTDYGAVIAGGNAATSGTDNSGLETLFKQYLGNQTAPESQADLYKRELASSGVPESQQRLKDLQAQLTGITAEEQARQLKVREEGISSGAIQGRNIASERQMAIRALPLQAQIAAEQGNLQLAQDRLNTVFQLKVQDAQNMYNYKQKLIDSVYDFATKQEQAKLDAKKLQDQQAFEAKKINNQQAFEISKLAMNAGQYDIASQIQQIDWSDPNASQKLASLQSQIQMSPADKLDMAIKQAQLIKLQKETSLLGEPTKKQQEEAATKLKTEQGQIETLQDKSTAIDALKKGIGMENRVGPNFLSRGQTSWAGGLGKLLSVVGIPSLLKNRAAEFSGAGQAFAGGVHQLTSQEFLDALISAKQQGATFGALTDREGDALRAAATKINDWEIKDSKTGRGLGVWNVSQSEFIKELDRIQELANKAIQRSQGTLFTSDENATLDSVFGTQDASSYYK